MPRGNKPAGNVFNEREEDAEAEGEGERVDEATDEGLEGLELDG